MTLQKNSVPVQTLIVNGHKLLVKKLYVVDDYATGDGSEPQGTWQWTVDWQTAPGESWNGAEHYIFSPLDNPQPPVADENIEQVIKAAADWANKKQPGGF